MPSLDLAMPIALLVVVTVAMLLNKRVQGKLMETVEQKEFKLRDIILLVVFIAIAITFIALTTMYAPGQIFQNILMIVFLGSYTTLLFTFSYVFSNLTKKRAQMISAGFGVASLIAAIASLLGPLSDSFSVYRGIAFFVLSGFCFGATVFEQIKTVENKSRWYVAAQPPALFVLMFVFFNFIYSGALQVWYPILMDVFGFTFAVLIILYLSSMFNWKTVGLFAVLLTTLDIILVIGTGTMVVAAKQFTGLGLPVLVYLPNVPFVYSTTGALLSRGLGLGDFFFAGVLAVQTFNKFGKKTAFIAAIAMAVAFGIWEAFLPDIITGLIPIVGRNIQGFPGTLMIISGWAPIVALKLLILRNKTTTLPIGAEPTEAPKEQSLPIQ
ncbi:MAG TPA: hypothetical protein VF350_08535 [Candidatus Bathyarchaeia archaeon]